MPACGRHPVHGQDLGPHRVAGDGHGQVGLLEGHRRGLGEEAGQPIGGAGPGVLLGHHDRHPPQHRADHAGDAGVAPEDQHHGRAAAAHQPDPPGDGLQQAPDGGDVLQGEAALDPPAGQER